MPFSQQSIDFLIENKIHDSRAWYQEHKGLYAEFVLEPFAELVARLSPAMLKIDTLLMDKIRKRPIIRFAISGRASCANFDDNALF